MVGPQYCCHRWNTLDPVRTSSNWDFPLCWKVVSQYYCCEEKAQCEPWRVFKVFGPVWNQVTSTMAQSPVPHFVEQLLPAALDPYPWYTDVFIHTRKRTLIWSLSIYISNKYIYFIYAYILKYAAHIAKQRKQTEFWARDEARIIWKKYFSLILSPLGRR